MTAIDLFATVARARASPGGTNKFNSVKAAATSVICNLPNRLRREEASKIGPLYKYPNRYSDGVVNSNSTTIANKIAIDHLPRKYFS
jgi:hypothetical protein